MLTQRAETDRDLLASDETTRVVERRIAAKQAPPVSYHHIQLPLTRLHYITCGDGPPLIMVPATISNIDNWLALAQFLGQRFKVHFFELPGHGSSTPFEQPFSSQLVADTVEAFIDQLGYPTVSLMGFSFGGILAMTTLRRLRQRVDKVILVSPVLSRRALQFSPLRLHALKAMVQVGRHPRLRAGVLRTIRDRRVNGLLAAAIARAGRVERSISVRDVFQKISDSTADVLCNQLAEMLNFDLDDEAFSQPCYFAMSVQDPLLSFETTVGLVQQTFSNTHIQRFHFPYHQPPRQPTFEEIDQLYRGLLDTIAP